MNGQINQLVKSLLQKESIDHCSVQELQQFAERHPYFGAAQLLLTKKLKTENSEQYNEQLQKTFLFFHNPLWVEKLLNDTGSAEVISTEKKEPVIDNPETPVVSSFENNGSATQHEPITANVPEEEENHEPVVDSDFRDPISNEPFKREEQSTEEPAIVIPPIKIEAIDPEKTELVFEPYHTVDYFASQGIKFKEEEKPKDKFGQQLKSFTDWLKTMKRLPVTEIVKAVETVSEQKVEQLAEHSLLERDIVTEAMAEVWEKQGNPAKAIDIYSKLSLLDPSKSRYFAAKIEELKKTN